MKAPMEILKQIQKFWKTAMMQEENNPFLDHNSLDIQDLVKDEQIDLLPLSVNQIDETLQQDSIVFIDEPNLKVFCRDCRKEINKTVSILSSAIYRCVGCFAKMEVASDSYQIIKGLSFPIVDPNWKANHEILFLNFLEKFGFGNWKEIKDQMDFYGAKHTEDELQQHYNNCYLSSKDYLPRILNNESFFQKKYDPTPVSKAQNRNQTSFASVATTTNREESQHEEIDDYYASNIQVGKEANFIEYYNEKRNEFEVEYDKDAELLLANLEFREDDSEEEVSIKFKLLNQYNRRLDRRNSVKKFVIEHRLLEENYQKEMDKNRNQHEKEAFDELKPIARLMNLQEYNEMVRKYAFTKQLKSTIEGLRMFRRAHPSNFKSLDEFLNSQQEESSKPRKRNQNDPSIKTGKRVQQVLEKQFKLTRRDFQNIVGSLQTNGKKIVYKNVEAVMLDRNY